MTSCTSVHAVPLQYRCSTFTHACCRNAICAQVEVGVQRETKPGQRVVLVGGHPALGSWDVAKAVSMSWSNGHVWKASIELPADTTDLHYKVSNHEEVVGAGRCCHGCTSNTAAVASHDAVADVLFTVLQHPGNTLQDISSFICACTPLY